MDVINSLDDLIKQIHSYNVIRLNKPRIVGVAMHPLTWDKIEPKSLVAVKNLRICFNENVPLDIIELGDLVKTDNNVLCYKINTLEDIEKLLMKKT